MNVNVQEQGSENNRRTFLKKAAYAAPALMVLGTLTEASAAKKDVPPGLAKKATDSKFTTK